MKKLKLAIDLLCALSVAAALAAIAFLPDEVPAHYGLGGEVDRYGSKYEMLIFPALNLAARLAMAGLTRLAATVEKDDMTGPVMRFVTALMLMFFLLMQLYFFYAAAVDAQNLNDLPLGVWQLQMGAMGAFFIPLGLAMPKAGRNSAVGFRCKWSMMNDEVWALSQRFAGRAMAASGALTIVCAAVLPGAWSAAAAAVILAVMAIADNAYAKRTYFKLRGF